MQDTFLKDLTAFSNAIEKKLKDVDAGSVRFVRVTCQEVERTAKSIMRDSPVNTAVSYYGNKKHGKKKHGKKKHHPSFAGNPPAPDTGALMKSITHSVENENGQAVGYVGSILSNPDYPRYLEYGTSKMKPRPWLKTALIKCQDFIANASREIFQK